MRARLTSAAMRLEEPVAIVGVTVLPLDSDRQLPNHTVLIQNGTITAIAPDLDVSNARVIDGRGKYLLPGLADMHTHFWDPGEAAMFLANGVTFVRNMWGAPFHLAWQRKVESGEIAGPRVLTTSPIVDGVTESGQPIWPGSATLPDPAHADRMVEGFVERGYQQVKAYSLLSAPAIAALGRACERAGVMLVGHCPSAVTMEQASTAGQRCFEHLTNMTFGHLRDGRVAPPGWVAGADFIAEHLDSAAIRDMARRFADEQTWNCPTMVVWQGAMDANVETVLANPLLRYESAATMSSWDPTNDFRFRGFERSKVIAAFQRMNDRRAEMISILHQEGAPLLIGTDTPNPFVFQGFSIHDELDNFVRAGLTPYEAIRCATVEPARFLGATDRGVVAEGRRADLILVDGDPFVDVSILRTPASVFVNGHVLTRADLDAMLMEREKQVLPRADIEPPQLGPDDRQVVRAGALADRTGGALTGCCSFRHTARDDGGLDIEEMTDGAGEDGLWRRRTVISLGDDRTITRASSEVVTEIGVRRFDAARTPSGYALRIEDEDGFVREEDLLSEALVPSERLALSAIGVVASAAGDIAALDADGRIARVSVARGEDEVSMVVHRYGERSELRVRLAEDDALLELSTMQWNGERVVEAVSD